MEILFFLVGLFLQWTLEVLGAGGAVWGMSEVWHLRGGTNPSPESSNDDLTNPANVVFALGFLRMLCRFAPPSALCQAIVDPQAWCKDWGASVRPPAAQGTPREVSGMFLAEFLFFLLGVFLQWDLEVLGAGGACWGMSEVWHLRGGTTRSDRGPDLTNDDYRWVANTVFTIAIFRMLQKYCPDHGIHKAMLSPQDWIKELGEEPAGKEEQEM